MLIYDATPLPQPTRYPLIVVHLYPGTSDLRPSRLAIRHQDWSTGIWTSPQWPWQGIFLCFPIMLYYSFTHCMAINRRVGSVLDDGYYDYGYCRKNGLCCVSLLLLLHGWQMVVVIDGGVE